jgi:hypothetical protein
LRKKRQEEVEKRNEDKKKMKDILRGYLSQEWWMIMKSICATWDDKAHSTLDCDNNENTKIGCLY